jgi:hypothetical protein
MTARIPWDRVCVRASGRPELPFFARPVIEINPTSDSPVAARINAIVSVLGQRHFVGGGIAGYCVVPCPPSGAETPAPFKERATGGAVARRRGTEISDSRGLGEVGLICLIFY